jgi:hypothetical protein
MKEKQTLHLKGIEFSLQEWKKSSNVSQVKYSENKNKKSSKTKIFRAPKHFSLIY